MLRLLLLITALVGTGCSTVHQRKLEQELLDRQPREKKLEIGFHPQQTNQCGPTSLYTILKEDLKADVSLDDITQMSYTPKAKGTLKRDLLSTIRRLGFAAYPINLENLPATLDENRPILIFQNLGLSWSPYWHYSVVVGYRSTDKTIFVHDGTTAFKGLSAKKTANTWDRGGQWSYVVTIPSDLPSTASFEQVMNNTSALRRLGFDQSVFDLFTAASHRWPQRFEPYVAIANFYAKNNEIKKATVALKKALALKQNVAGLHFNMYYLLTQSKHHRKASKHKEKAFQLATPAEREMFGIKIKEMKSKTPGSVI